MWEELLSDRMTLKVMKLAVKLNVLAIKLKKNLNYEIIIIKCCIEDSSDGYIGNIR